MNTQLCTVLSCMNIIYNIRYKMNEYVDLYKYIIDDCLYGLRNLTTYLYDLYTHCLLCLYVRYVHVLCDYFV